MGKEKMSKEQFKELCLSVVPAIFEIAEVAKNKGVEKGMSITIGEDGYVSFNVYDENWRFTRLPGEDEGRMCYEFSEKLKVPHPEARKLEFEHLTENVAEIAMTFENVRGSYPNIWEIEIAEWKQCFVEWANEFEEQWQEDDSRDYPKEIAKFTRRKILERLEERI